MRIGRLEEELAHYPPAEPVGGTTIKSIIPVQGEWFRLQLAYDPPSPTRLFISRVMLWALVEGLDVADHVLGIDETGVPHDDPATDCYYLCGTDLSPNGSAWSDVYGSIQPSLHQVREVTHLFDPPD